MNTSLPKCTGATLVSRAAWLVFAIGVCAVPRARAECFAVRDPQFMQLRPLISRNAPQALAKVRARLAALPAAQARADPKHLAALYALEAIAYGYLDLYAEQRTAAAKGLALVPDRSDPLHLLLLSRYARSFLDPAGADRALQLIEQARSALPTGSRDDLCLEITQSAIEQLQQHPGKAILHATHAYLRSAAAPLAGPHLLAAARLSTLLRGTGDFPDAFRLIQSKLDWDSDRGEVFSYRRDLFLKAEILEDMHRYRQAIAAFTRARALAVSLHYRLGTAFPDVHICRSQIALGRFAAARRHCERALAVFRAAGPVQMVAETRLLVARIDLGGGRPGRALAVTDAVLRRGGSDMLERDIAPAYLIRSQANAALHRYGKGYADLLQYLVRYHALRARRLRELKEALALRFQIREMARRNALLQRKLQVASARARQQTDLLRTMEIAGAAGALVTVLLSYILIAAARHRRQLLRLANEDNLTGVPNRGHTVKLAAAALQSARARNQPLTVALLDFDHFKEINDHCGHAAGDHVLREFAHLARGALRASDILGRWGGEEFLLVLPETTLDTALSSIERLRLLALGIAIPANDRPQPLPRVTFSAGLATTTEGAGSLDEIVARADAALYEAKNAGRDLVRIDPKSSRGHARTPQQPSPAGPAPWHPR